MGWIIDPSQWILFLYFLTLPWGICSNVGGRSSSPAHGNDCDEEAVLDYCFSCRISLLRYRQLSLTWNNYLLRLNALKYDSRRKGQAETLEDTRSYTVTLEGVTVTRKVAGTVLWPVPDTSKTGRNVSQETSCSLPLVKIPIHYGRKKALHCLQCVLY